MTFILLSIVLLFVVLVIFEVRYTLFINAKVLEQTQMFFKDAL